MLAEQFLLCQRSLIVVPGIPNSCDDSKPDRLLDSTCANAAFIVGTIDDTERGFTSYVQLF